MHQFNITFRLGVDQADKLRACDDLEHILTNLACSVVAPIRLVSWDHLAQLSQILAEKKIDWGLIEADHEAAYKQLPIEPADQTCAIIALRHPTSGKWYGFATRALIFGAVAAVLHYNVGSWAITALVNLIFGLPMVCYLDDFAALAQLCLGGKALAVFSRFWALLGIQLKPGESSAGNKIIFLGLLGEFPCAQNSCQLAISLTPEKRGKRASLIASYLKRGQLSHRCLGKLIGRFSFSKTALFGKFARTQLRPRYTKLHRLVYNALLSSLESSTMSRRLRIIAEFARRLSVPRPSRADWLIYTDAATEPATLRALLFRGDSDTPSLDACCSQRTAVTWDYLFRTTSLIYGLELLALVAFCEDHAPRLRAAVDGFTGTITIVLLLSRAATPIPTASRF